MCAGGTATANSDPREGVRSGQLQHNVKEYVRGHESGDVVGLKFLSSCLVIAEDAFEIADPAVVQALRPFVDRLATHMGEATTVRLAPEGLAAWSDQLLLVMSLVQGYAALTYPSLCHKTGSLLCGRSGQANASW
jgi:hypothetical protein